MEELTRSSSVREARDWERLDECSRRTERLLTFFSIRFLRSTDPRVESSLRPPIRYMENTTQLSYCQARTSANTANDGQD
jgi:hypothetical protein